MMWSRWLVVLGVLGMTACVESSAVTCGDRTCPASFVCTPSGERCVPADALSTCRSAADGDACEAGGVGGSCRDGICEVPVCGDGVIEGDEVCDDRNVTAGDGCNPTCRSDETCGNGYVDPDEGCDCGDGADEHANATCTKPNSDDDDATCRPDCTPHRCGDGEIEGVEQCEAGMTPSKSCSSFGFYEGSVGCNGVCQFDTTGCSKFCGDGVVNGGTEVCDGAAPPDSCLVFGYDGGRMACSDFCTPAFDACFSIGWRDNIEDQSGFMSVDALSASAAWGGTRNGEVTFWDGATWTKQALGGSSAGYFVRGIYAAAVNDVYAIVGAEVFHYNGTAWSVVYTAPNGTFNALSGNGTRVIAVGADIIASYDGSTWETHTASADYFSDVFVVSPTSAYAVGGDEDVMTWLYAWSGGTTWTPVTTLPAARNASAVWASGPDDLYVGGTTLMHWDGTTWSTIGLGVDQDVADIHGTSPSNVYVAFADEALAHFDGSTWTFHDTTVASRVVAAGDYAFAAGDSMVRMLGSSWTRLRSDRIVDFNDVSGVPGGPILAVGSRGHVLSWDGAFWRNVSGDAANSFFGVSGAVAVGDMGMLATFDGTRMVRRTTDTVDELYGVWAASASDAWAVGQNGRILHFTGTSASTVASGATVDLHAIWGFSTSHIYAVGDDSTILHYNGSSWQTAALPALVSFDIRAIWGAPTADCASGCFMVAGNAGQLHRWNGSAWVNESITGGLGFTSIFGASSSEIYATRADGLLYRWVGTITSASAGTWTQVPTTRLVDIVGGGSGGVFAGGADLALQRRIGSTAFVDEIPDLDAPLNHRIVDLYAVSTADVYALGFTSATGAYSLYHYDGTLWSRVTTPGAFPQAVSGTGPDDVFVVSGATTAYRWNGTTWQSQSMPAGSASAIDMTATLGFAVGSNTIRRYQAGSWTSTPSNTTKQLNAVWVAPNGEAFAVGTNGAVLRYASGTWSEMTTPLPADNYYAVWGTSATNVYVAGGNGVIGHYTGTWSVESGLGTAVLTTLWGSGPNDIFAGGVAGALFHYDGVSWNRVRSATLDPITAMTGAGTTLIVGGAAPTPTIQCLERFAPW